jgi:hypothetical protein
MLQTLGESGRQTILEAAKLRCGIEVHMASGLDPVVQRRRLRVELRKAREAAGVSQKDVAPEMDGPCPS